MDSMDLNNADLLKLQTQNMKKDPTTIAMCAAINPQLKAIAKDVVKCLLLSRVDELPEALLDELAWELHIDWYDSTAPIETKRKLVKTSDEVHKYLGTPYAVEQVIQAYFGDGEVEEWFEYGGQPGMFRVLTSNAAVTGALAAQFIKVLEPVKRKSAHLEEIIITLAAEMNIYFAAAVCTNEYIEIEVIT